MHKAWKEMVEEFELDADWKASQLQTEDSDSTMVEGWRLHDKHCENVIVP